MYDQAAIVAPFAGARIEITAMVERAVSENVAPFAGARIEIPQTIEQITKQLVAPFAGARIEILLPADRLLLLLGRSLRGSAD